MPNLVSDELCVGCMACATKCPKHCLTINFNMDVFFISRNDK